MQKNKMEFISVVIPVYNSGEVLADCLNSLLSLDHPDDLYEVLIVLDPSDEATIGVLEFFKDKIKLIENETRAGVSESRNIGVNASRGNLIAFVDSDCIVPRDWLKKLLPYLEPADVAGVSSYHDPVIEGPLKEHLLEMRSIQFNKDSTKQIVITKPEEKKEVDAIPTNSSIFKKKNIQLVGGFDKCLTSGEDIDLCWRIVGSGYKLLLIPDSLVSHHLKGHLKSFLKKHYWYGQGIPYLFMKHPKKMKMVPFVYLFMVIIVLDIYLGMLHQITIARILFIFMILAPLIRFLPETDLKKGLYWNVEHIVIDYLKMIANLMGIIRSTIKIMLNPLYQKGGEDDD